MLELIQHIRRRLRELPRDTRNLEPAREVLRNSKTILDVVQTAGYKLDATEEAFFRSLPPLIGGALKGAILDSIEPSNRSHISFDVAYLAGGTDYTLTVSAPKRTGEVSVVLQAPMPGGAAGLKAKGVRSVKAGTRRATTRKRAPARKRRG